ncbi:hypothetical protein [Nocardia crassostreae]|uniref:hypothetical protein n=1 Tax=Nocardia crassostreae TaxID=53428 RepID=UPI000829B1D2|nr:hypothetical protein [Nocardia crassostreae]
MTESAAKSLAQQQEELVRALVAGAEPPPGFDHADLSAAAHALLHKRAEEVARRYPLLAHRCGGEFTALFVAWARARPKLSTPADAAAFAAQHDLPDPRPSESRWTALRARIRRTDA